MEKGFKMLSDSMKFILLLLLLLLIGCAGVGPASFKDGQTFFAAGDYDNAVGAYTKAVEESPSVPEYKMRLEFARARAAVTHNKLGDGFLESAQYTDALKEYRIAAYFDPTIETATVGILTSENHLEAERLVREGRNFILQRRNKQAKKVAELALLFVPDFQEAVALVAEIDASSPTIIDGVVLEVKSADPITLNFNKVRMPEAVKILTNLSGINFILDEDIRSKTTTLHLEKATFAQALELMLSMNKLDKKILNPKTIILFPRNKDKQKQFEDQIIQTFYLSNIDAKKAVNLLRTILQLRKVYVHEELNAVVLRDKPSVIRLAEKILEANDRSSSEVVFDLELIEVSHSDSLKIGPKLDPYGFSVGLSAPGSASNTIDNIVVSSLDGLNTLYSLPTATFDLAKQSSNGEVLASPKIRVKDKGKAKVHIGSREPVVTVTINGDQTSENVQYIDVGVKLDVEPTIRLDNTVVTKLGLEVSNVAERSTTANGTAILTISTTTANTTLTLKDGEQTILGGLIRTSETKSNSTIPILGDIPLIGRFFTGHGTEKTKREILLSITPHIVKSLSIPPRDVTSLWSGGEDNFKNGANFGSFTEDYQSSSSKQPPNAIPANTPRGVIDTSFVDETFEDATPASTDREMKKEIKVDSEIRPAVSSETIKQGGMSEQPVKTVENNSLVFIIGRKPVIVGSHWELTIIAEEVKNLFSAPMYIRYDPELLDFVSASEGSFMKKGGKTSFTSSNMAEKGLVIVGLKLSEQGEGVSGGGALFKLTFKPKATGFAEVRAEKINLRNPQGDQLPVISSGFTVEIE